MIQAIVYTSNSGYTKEYAQLLGEKTGLLVCSMGEAGNTLESGKSILYLGWIMAGTIKGYKAAAKRYQISAVCGVGMAATGSQLEEVRKKNQIPDCVPVFTLQGGFDITRLHGVYKFMMNTMRKTAGKALADKKDRTPDEDKMLEMMEHGGNCVSEENLREVLAWYEGQK